MTIKGFLEFADVSWARGWAFDPDAPDERLEVVVRIGNEFLISGRADVKRNDLLAAGIGDGCHAFNIDLTPARLPPDAKVDVYVVSGEGTAKLPRAGDRSNRIADLISRTADPIRDEGQFPVFVLGPARSGTSAMALALLHSARYRGTGEGHLLPLAHALLGVVDRHYQRYGTGQEETLLGRVSGDAFQRFIRRGFVQLAKDLFPTGYWLDKTPTVEMVRAAPLMRELWPNARFIFMKRRVIENVLSRQRKFAGESIDRHYSDWLAVMAAWLAARDALADSAIEVEHRRLVLDPSTVATEVSDFLQLPEPAAARFSQYLQSDRPEQTDASFGATYAFDDLRLSDADGDQMKAACDALMLAFGYGYDRSYFASSIFTESK